MPEHHVSQPLARFRSHAHRLRNLLFGCDSRVDQENSERGARSGKQLTGIESRVFLRLGLS